VTPRDPLPWGCAPGQSRTDVTQGIWPCCSMTKAGPVSYPCHQIVDLPAWSVIHARVPGCSRVRWTTAQPPSITCSFVQNRDALEYRSCSRIHTHKERTRCIIIMIYMDCLTLHMSYLSPCASTQSTWSYGGSAPCTAPTTPRAHCSPASHEAVL